MHTRATPSPPHPRKNNPRMYELPVEVHMIRLDKGQHKQKEYLSINPLGKVKEGGSQCGAHTVPAWHTL